MPTPNTYEVDPVVVASLYCHDRIDDVLYRMIASYRADLDAMAGGPFAIWCTRSVRCGEHLKIRVHGPESSAPLLRRRLQARAEEFLDGLPVTEPTTSREFFPEAIPIDREDESAELYPDRTLQWRRYRRLPGTMGRPPLSEDLELAAFFTRCLSRGTRVVLEGLAPDGDGAYPQRMRTGLVTKLFLVASRSLFTDATQAAEYFEYHRNWLILASGESLTKGIGLFDRRASRDAATVQALAGMLATPAGPASGAMGAWAELLTTLYAHVLQIGPPLDRNEPLVIDQLWAPLFKSLHTLANLVRVGLFNEALLCHLLAGAWRNSVRATPEVRNPEPTAEPSPPSL